MSSEHLMHSKLVSSPKIDMQNNPQPKKINNLVWLGLVGSVVVITGVIASF